jgi:hypothetical protein
MSKVLGCASSARYPNTACVPRTLWTKVTMRVFGYQLPLVLGAWQLRDSDADLADTLFIAENFIMFGFGIG